MSQIIKICMGSSCFARGNEQNLSILEDYLSTHTIDCKVELSGSCCEGFCSEGPNISIDGVLFTGVDSGKLLDILTSELPCQN